VVIAEATNGKFYLVEEIAEREKYIEFWIDEAKKMMSKYKIRAFYCDSARPEYVKKFRLAGINAVNAKKDVIEGIGYVGSLLKQEKLFFLRSAFKKGLSEMYQYVWKTNSSTDEVVKTNDDVLDSVRYALFSSSVKNIQIMK
jgi:phage terminase large subunit